VTAAKQLRLTIITGLSGAGKSQAVATFEDMGYFCIDNLPPQMLASVFDLFSLEGSRVDHLAVVFDVRAAPYFDELVRALDDLAARGAHCRILFLEASDEALVARYQSTRRPHPMGSEASLLTSIEEERQVLMRLRERADFVVDTSDLNVHELRHRLQETLFAGELTTEILVTFVSFGFKFGVPTEADMVLDARFLPNPHWVPELRPLTGLDQEVSEFVVARPESYGFIERVAALVLYLVPFYLAEQKTQLVVAIGCTGGRHRSVALAEVLAASLDKDAQVRTRVRHRDVERSG
jgi:UPF0042 nucleotide-binding protein